MKKIAFTLGEVLVTLAIVGIIASMVIPGVVHDTHQKANIIMLKKTIGSLTLLVQNDALKHNNNISDMDIANNPKKFLEGLDTVYVGKGSNAPKKCGNSGTLAGVSMDLKTNYTIGGSNSTVALLKNGVCVYLNTANPVTKEAFDISLGNSEVFGVGIFSGELVVAPMTNSSGFQENVGELHSDFISDNSLAEEKKKCYKGTSRTSCLNILLQTSWDPNYMKDYKLPKEEGT